MPAKILTTTFTGEPFQPVRLYYEVLNLSILTARFQRLRCLEYVPDTDRWCWYYNHEAKDLPFQKPSSAIPKDMRPLILGYFRFESPSRLTLSLRSIDRALKAVEFFSEKIPQRAWRADRVRLVNGLREAPSAETAPDSLEDFLDVETVEVRSDEQFEAEVNAIAAQHTDQAEQTRAINRYLEQKMREPLPPVEEFTVDVRERVGLEQFVMALQMRHVVAVQHWNGNTRFSRFDILQKMMGQEPTRPAIEL